jgi:hypothetical protein
MEQIDENVNDKSLLQLLATLNKIKELLKRKIHIIILGGIVGVLLYGTFFFLKSPKYIGNASFIMREKSVSTSTALSNIASQLGVDLSGSSSAGSVFAGENILDIIKSKYIITKALLTATEDSVGNKQTLANLYLNFSKLKKDLIEKDIPASAINFPINQNVDKLNNIQDSVIQLIIKKVTNEDNFTVERSNKKATIINVQVKSKNKEFSRLLPTRLIEEATEFYINTKVGVLEKDIAKMENKADSIIALLNNKTYLSAELTENDLNPALNTATVPVELALRDKTVLYKLYGEVIKQLELAKADLIREKPIIQILDSPGLTLFNIKSFLFY